MYIYYVGAGTAMMHRCQNRLTAAVKRQPHISLFAVWRIFMDVMLIGTSFNEEVHGTSNGKKTGCGVNLLKSGNDTKYRQIGRMNDLKEITCEKCKEKIAKEMIKADKKEMARLLKEEKARIKAGIEDEGIVPLGNTTARITGSYAETKAPEPEPSYEPEPTPVYEPEPASAYEPEPQPVPPVQPAPARTIAGTGVPMDDDLAQFAINAPVPEEPAPAPKSDDDFLAQFAINKPAPEPEQPANNVQDDFLAQFAIDPHAQEKPKPDENDDIMNMFSIGNQPQETVEQLPQDEPAPVQGMYDNDSNVVDVEEDNLTAVNEPQQTQQNNAWDIFANQFFGMNQEIPSEPEPEPEEAPLEMDDMPAVAETAAPPPVPAPSAPVLDDITPEELSPVLDEIIPPAREETEPELEDIEIPSFDSVIPPANEDIAPPELDEIEVPQFYDSQTVQEEEPEYETDDIAIPDFEDISAPVQQPAPAPVQQPAPAPVQQPAPAPVQQSAPVQQPAPAPVQQSAPAPVQQPAPAPVQQPAPAPVQQPAPAPVQQPAPVQYQQPAPFQYQQPAPVQYQQPAVGQFMTVPTGYDQNGQPIYAYMQITGYDMNGQPILAPVAPPTGMPMPNMQPQFTAPVQPTAPKFGGQSAAPSKYGKAGLTPGQKIAAEAAAKGNMMDANISKIATNPHSKSTSDAFIHAISESKGKANQSLTDTQGLKPSAPVITSIEDMLSQLGDNSDKEKPMKEEAAAKNLPKYEEFTSASIFNSRTSRTSAPKPKVPAQPDRPLTKKELKELEKQRKIDEKFRKEMEKRKG